MPCLPPLATRRPQVLEQRKKLDKENAEHVGTPWFRTVVAPGAQTFTLDGVHTFTTAKEMESAGTGSRDTPTPTWEACRAGSTRSERSWSEC